MLRIHSSSFTKKKKINKKNQTLGASANNKKNQFSNCVTEKYEAYWFSTVNETASWSFSRNCIQVLSAFSWYIRNIQLLE